MSHYCIFWYWGGLLFVFYSYSNDSEESQNSIAISKERINQLISEWEKQNLSIPTSSEKQAIIDKEIYQRVLYKEALKIGLDKNDNTIKGHLAQKMEIIVFDTEELTSPSDEKLKQFMQEHLDKYREEEKIHFSQSMMQTDTMPFEKEYTLTKFGASSIFGRSFSEMLFTLKADGKKHKIESEYGVHDVQILDKVKSGIKAFETIKEKLRDDYLKLQREEKNRVAYEALKSQYTISLEEQ